MSRSTPKLASFRRIVVKVGSSLLVDAAAGGLKRDWLEDLAADIAALHRSKDGATRDVLVVSSGSIALGRAVLNLPRGALKLEEAQGAAAVGQIALARSWSEVLGAHNMTAGQVLLTLTDTEERRRYLNARSTVARLLEWRCVPVINENDTVATDEIKLGDNDTLAALVTNLIEADALVILTDQAGLFDADPRKSPHARIVEQADAGDPRLESLAGGAGSALGKGGMLTKVLAARRAARSGAHTVIASGAERDVLVRLASGERIGTLLTAQTVPLAARKQWLADRLAVSGRVRLDAGAVRALTRDGKSLLPIGVTEVTGEFQRGEVVACLDPAGREIARGLANYSSTEARQIIRKPSGEIESVLGYVDEPELIHRDNLVLL
jgi:glutamate 5-kinase